jgi:hypothetical protein
MSFIFLNKFCSKYFRSDTYIYLITLGIRAGTHKNLNENSPLLFPDFNLN